MITRYLADLLYHNDCVIVPGLGGFIKACTPARILHTTHEFFPPSGNIAFNGSLSGNDGLLANYMASAENISYREALLEIRQWVENGMDTIKKGEILAIAEIGLLFLNTSGKIEFTPSNHLNFNIDSFGLPIFIAKPVESKKFDLPALQPLKYAQRNTKLRRLVPETLKWAAVLAPFVAFGLWGALNGNVVDNYVHNYTGMYSWVRSTPGKTAAVRISATPTTPQEIPSEVILSPAEILAGENIVFEPNVISYAELEKYNVVITEPVPDLKTDTPVIELNYHIIGGAFREHTNALKLIAILQEQGYPASVIDTTPGGLYVVSMRGYYSLNEASSQLEEIKKAGFSSSWILKKHKS
jgi:hypothetical protein